VQWWRLGKTVARGLARARDEHAADSDDLAHRAAAGDRPDTRKPRQGSGSIRRRSSGRCSCRRRGASSSAALCWPRARRRRDNANHVHGDALRRCDSPDRHQRQPRSLAALPPAATLCSTIHSAAR
jgi:hypothetical protein